MKRARHSWCRACVAEYQADKKSSMTQEERDELNARRRGWDQAHMERLKKRHGRAAYQFRYRWKITDEERQVRLDAQGGICANLACNREATQFDHDHRCCSGNYTCGECFRGVLCQRCNLRLRSVEKDLDLIRGLVTYLDAAKERMDTIR